MKYVFFIILFFSSHLCSAQHERLQYDSLAIERIWEWSQTVSLESVYYFRRMYTYPLQPSQSYVHKGNLVYHFPDRCVDNVVVVDSLTLQVVDSLSLQVVDLW